MQNLSLRQITLPLALTLASTAFASPVLVIDEGSDLNHPLLAPLALQNATEAKGQPNIDDDKNGFVDDVAGWNSVSNDGEYFPTRIRAVFEKNQSRIKELFDLYSKVELGDTEALAALRASPTALRTLQGLMSVSHGTHVAGIVAGQFMKNTPFLQSYNVFTASKEVQDSDSDTMAHPMALSKLAHSYSTSFMKQFSVILQTANDSTATASGTPASAFDDINNFKSIIEKSRVESTAKAERLKNFLRTHNKSVANLSLGFTKALYIANLNQLWAAELEERGLAGNTPRTPAQEQVLQSLADTVIEINKSFYRAVFAEFPNTLFVVAAGNDGEPSDPDAGNNDKTPVWPANLSLDYPNVITVAAVDAKGIIADFSDFGLTTVNVAAPGKAIRSTAPGGLDVVMSGTSMAAPYVAGLAARVRLLNPKLSAAQVRKLLEKTGKKVASLNGKCTTGAMVDPDAAAQAAISSKDIDFDKAIDITLRNRDVFSGKIFVMSTFNSLTTPIQGESSRTPKMVRDLMRGMFYK